VSPTHSVELPRVAQRGERSASMSSMRAGVRRGWSLEPGRAITGYPRSRGSSDVGFQTTWKVALRFVIRERLIYLDKTELDARVRVSRSQVFVELFTRTKTRIFLKKTATLAWIVLWFLLPQSHSPRDWKV